MDLLRARLTDLPEELRNCFLLAFSQFMIHKKLVNRNDLILLKAIKNEFTWSSEQREEQLFVKTKSDASEIISKHARNEMLIKEGVTFEDIVYLQQRASDFIYAVQILEREKEVITHHVFSTANELMKMELYFKGDVCPQGYSSRMSYIYLA